MKARINQIAIHIVCSLAFLLFPILSSPDFPNVKATLSNPGGINDLYTYFLLLAFFYVTYYVLIPKLYFRQKYFLFAGSIIVYALLMSLSLRMLFQPYPHFTGMPRPSQVMPPPPGNPHHGRPPHFNFLRMFFFGYSMYLLLIVLFIAMLLKTNQRWRRLQNEKLETELSYLKAQINPHFLFNTLNSIYSLAIEKSDYTATAVVKLSGMMRYIISESNKHFVPLQKELNYIGDYIELQKFRMGGTVQISYRLSGHAGGKEIAPLLLITFVENAFKYGVNPEEYSDILTEIRIENDSLTLTVANYKVNHSIHHKDSSGLGIANARHRLEMLYPGRYTLDIEDGSQKFTVHLKISLK